MKNDRLEYMRNLNIEEIPRDEKIVAFCFNDSIFDQMRYDAGGRALLSIRKKEFLLRDIVEAIKYYELDEVLCDGEDFYDKSNSYSDNPHLFVPVICSEDDMRWYVDYINI